MDVTGHCLITTTLSISNTDMSLLLLLEGDMGWVSRQTRHHIKGIVYLNIIFSYMKVNKICNLDHLVY